MRFPSLLLSVLILSGATTVYAQNVLLPDEDGSRGEEKAPSLGIGTEVSTTQKPVTTQKPATTTQAKPYSSSTDLTPTAPTCAATGTCSAGTAANVSAQSLKKVPAVKLSPGGAISTEVTDMERLMAVSKAGVGNSVKSSEAEMNAALETFKKTGTVAPPLPPGFIDDIDIPENPNAPALPSELRLSIDSNYFWGPMDVRIINTNLGYTSQQIPQNCQLRLEGTVNTDKSMYLVKVYSGQQQVLRYDGALTAISLRGRAVCNPPENMPQRGGIIMRTGGKFGVFLAQPVACTIPNPSITTLEIKYKGDGVASCEFH